MKAIMRDKAELSNYEYSWMGSLPISWNKPSLLYVLRTKISDGPHETPEYVENGIPFISIDSLNETKNISLKDCKRYITEEDYIRFSQKTRIEKDDILFSKAATIGKTAIIKDEKIMVWSPLAIIKANQNIINNEYLYHVLNCDKLIMDVSLSGSMNTQINVGMRELEHVKIPLPPFEEQQLIANYLDDRCSKIDAIIAEAKASIEEYKELKQAVIYEAVTKGLDKNVEMKDSGVEWLDDIPANWHLVKITRILDKNHPYAIGDGDHGSIKTDQYLDCGIPFIRVQNLGWGTKLNLENVVYISEEDNRQIQNSTLKPDDILFAKTGATIGKTAIIPKDVPVANTTSHVGKITISKEHNPRYVFYVLSSQVGYRQFWDIALQKTTRPELSIEETKSIKVILPNDRELEDKIVKFLDEKIPVFDELINTKQSLIEDLESYKKSLIYEVVTGKRKVVA